MLLGITLAFLVAALATGGFLFAGFSKVINAIPTPADFAAAMSPEPYVEITPAVITGVREMAELTTVEMTEYTIVEKGTDEGWLQWARGDSVRLMAIADIGAGVDLSGISASAFSVDDSGVVEVTLPHAEIHYVAVDNQATQILDREKGLFTKGDTQLETEARQIAETVLVESALEKGILADSERNARVALTNLLTSLGYTEVIVSFQ